MSVSGALPEKSESFRFAAYGRKPTAVADGLQDMLSRDSSLVNRELGPPALIMEEQVSSPTRSSPPRQSKEEGPFYGELVVLGTNGKLRCPALSPKMKSRFMLRRQPKATGVRPSIREVSEEQTTPGAYTVSVTLPKLQTSVTEFEADPDTDLFQVGRSADQCINYVVVETEVTREGREQYKANSTVSRYACRILCERKPPYTARIYAAAFDTNKKIKLSTMAPTWVTCEGSDGLTTNGVVVMHPQGYFEPGVEGGEWQEVTVMGNVRKLRTKRSSRSPGGPLPAETNILTDGCLIDLCGVTLMWRSAMGLEQTPSRQLITQHLQELNQGAMHCPVGLQTLYLPVGSRPQQEMRVAYMPERHPWVYLACGHVHGPHEWRAENDETNQQRTCPICREVGPFVRLRNGEERSYCLDMQPPTHAFVPCGHMCSVNTAKYWSSVPIQYSIDKWSTVCPFCKRPLSQADQGPGYVKLIFA